MIDGNQAWTQGHRSIPATCPLAVHAYGDRQASMEHVEHLRELMVCVRVPSRLDDALADLVGALSTKADRAASKMREPLSPRLRRVSEDLDRMIASPGDLAIAPRAFWLLGVLAALAAVRSAYWDAMVRSRIARVSCIDLYTPMLHRHLETAEDRWATQRRQIEHRHPWVCSGGGEVTLVGIESTSPRFVFDGRG